MEQSIIELKTGNIPQEIHPMIRGRWSPRAFSEQPITQKMMEELFEAARWAPSAFNEQPWQFVYALKGTEGFEKLWACLSSGNQPWVKNAAAITVAMIRKTYVRNGKLNHWASHDLGLANAQLLVQAMSRDLYGHLMAGFDASKVVEMLNLSEDVEPICMGAFGYLGKPESLEEPYHTRELATRTRKPTSEFVTKLD